MTVNGKEVKQEIALESLIAVPLEKGENKVTFRFLPKYYIVSLIVTGFGVICLVLVFLCEVKKYDMAKPFRKLAGSVRNKVDALAVEQEETDGGESEVSQDNDESEQEPHVDDDECDDDEYEDDDYEDEEYQDDEESEEQ